MHKRNLNIAKYKGAFVTVTAARYMPYTFLHH
jgi:hypothetical protein